MKPNILVTASGSAIAHGIIKSLHSSGLDCNIIAVDSQPYAAGLYRGKAGYLVPLAKSENFIDRIIEICKAEEIQGVMIGTDYELMAFAKNRKPIEAETQAKVFVSSPDVIQIADDKWLTNQFLKENGLSFIPSALPENRDALIEQEGFPLILKPRIGDSSKNTFVVRNVQELNEKLAIIDRDSNQYLSTKVGAIVQKYMGKEHEEYTSSTAVFDGKPYGVVSMNREMRFGGHTTKGVIRDFSEINAYIRKVAEVLKPYGPCNFQSRVVNGIPYIFEINARFSGTTGICAHIGFNVAAACIQKEIMGKPIDELTFKTGTVLRYFNELFIPETDIEEIAKTGQVQHPQSVNNTSF